MSVKEKCCVSFLHREKLRKIKENINKKKKKKNRIGELEVTAPATPPLRVAATGKRPRELPYAWHGCVGHP
jgi:hypothetical protein